MAAADTELASQYGVSPAVIEQLRLTKCTAGVHWKQDEPGNRISWLPAGLDLLPTLLGLKKKKGAAPVQTVCLTILRIFPNPTWVLVATPDGGTAQVRVRHNKHLQVRMQIDCHATAEGGWRCVHSGLATG